MKVTMVMVASADGKTTRGSESSIYKWTSKEDQEFFFSLIQKSRLIVMGAKTYEAARPVIKLDPQTLRIVLTRHPEKYKKEVVKNQLEFSRETPSQLCKRLKQKGYKKMLLAGGAKINTLFLQEKLVNEFFLTVEPLIFGTGNLLIDKTELNIELKLIRSKKLNPSGTLLLHYKIL